MKVLVTGGAGFIGRHLVKLLAPSHDIIVLDSFEEIVHGPTPNKAVEGAGLVVARPIEDLDACRYAVQHCEAIIHLAAGVSVEASFDEPSRFVRTNSLGTAVLWEAIHREGTVHNVIVASSMSVYGGGWDYRGVNENDPCRPMSIYGWSKYDTEQLSLLAGHLYGVGVTSLRLWNTYGPGQSLTNAETGVAAIFAARLLAGQAPLVHEDGMQTRDFVQVSDVARAFKQALDSQARGIFNIGSGRPITVYYLAARLCDLISHGRIMPEVTHCYRPGDVRHCYPAIDLARAELGWQPDIDLDLGLAHYADWLLKTQTATG
jgi:dTDP-L-rhamnose 4-epimerase